MFKSGESDLLGSNSFLSSGLHTGFLLGARLGCCSCSIVTRASFVFPFEMDLVLICRCVLRIAFPPPPKPVSCGLPRAAAGRCVAWERSFENAALLPISPPPPSHTAFLSTRRMFRCGSVRDNLPLLRRGVIKSKKNTNKKRCN